MKKNLFILSLIAASGMLAACNDQSGVENFTDQESAEFVNDYRAPSFAEPDKSKKLSGTPAENLKSLFEAAGPEVITSMGKMNITDAQYQEIAEFTTSLVAGKTTQTMKHKAIFEWITKNITYGQSDPDPYAVFKNKKCVCQGYANLLTVMCYSQDIPAVVVNGFLDGYGVYGGHAWNYVCPDGVWMVSDPTNNGYWKMSEISKYTHLFPSEADVDLFADDCAVYRYYDYNLNVHEVTATSSTVVIPYSVGGFVIGSFNPTSLPETVSEVYLGENITTFGETYNMRLNDKGVNLRAIHIDEDNSALKSHKGVVYRKNGDEAQLYYIPGGMEYIELLPMKVVEKNTIYNHSKVKEICFPEGTEELEAYAVENCPMLERVYVPEGTTVRTQALYNCKKRPEIIYGIPSSIKHVTM